MVWLSGAVVLQVRMRLLVRRLLRACARHHHAVLKPVRSLGILLLHVGECSVHLLARRCSRRVLHELNVDFFLQIDSTIRKLMDESAYPAHFPLAYSLHCSEHRVMHSLRGGGGGVCVCTRAVSVPHMREVRARRGREGCARECARAVAPESGYACQVPRPHLRAPGGPRFRHLRGAPRSRCPPPAPPHRPWPRLAHRRCSEHMWPTRPGTRRRRARRRASSHRAQGPPRRSQERSRQRHRAVRDASSSHGRRLCCVAYVGTSSALTARAATTRLVQYTTTVSSRVLVRSPKGSDASLERSEYRNLVNR